VQPDEEAVLPLDSTQIDADPEANRMFRANHVRVISMPQHSTDCMQPIDVGWAKSFKDCFSSPVGAQTGSDVLEA
jgi:hypothetical protein